MADYKNIYDKFKTNDTVTVPSGEWLAIRDKAQAADAHLMLGICPGCGRHRDKRFCCPFCGNED